mgnify:CR=1 FL=1
MAAMAKPRGPKMSPMDLHYLHQEYKRLALSGKAEGLARMQEIEQIFEENGQNPPKVRFPKQDQARLRSTVDEEPQTPFKKLDNYVTFPNTDSAAAAASMLRDNDHDESPPNLMEIGQEDLDHVLGDSSDDPFSSLVTNLDEEGYFDKALSKSKGKGRK